MSHLKVPGPRFAVPALVVALLIAGGCSTGRRATESVVEHALQGPFYDVPPRSRRVQRGR